MGQNIKLEINEFIATLTFDLENEKVNKLSFAVLNEFNEKLDEIDYPVIYAKPHPKIVAALEKHTDVLEMYKNHLPESL